MASSQLFPVSTRTYTTCESVALEKEKLTPNAASPMGKRKKKLRRAEDAAETMDGL
jgi:hypothetical protein